MPTWTPPLLKLPTSTDRDFGWSLPVLPRSPQVRRRRRAGAKLATQGIRVKVATGTTRSWRSRVCQDPRPDLRRRAASATDRADQVDSLDDIDPGRRDRGHDGLSPGSPGRRPGSCGSGRAPALWAILGDRVNDALALRTTADVGISVDSATDVAKDAADVIMLEKDLSALARRGGRWPTDLRQHHQVRAHGHVIELRQHVQRHGRPPAFLPFLPMLPVPDPAQQPALRQLVSWPFRPITSTRSSCTNPRTGTSGSIRRFMVVFGPLSSVFDVATFAVLLWVILMPAQRNFLTGWFRWSPWRPRH